MIHACDDGPANASLANIAAPLPRVTVVACSRSSPERLSWVQMDVKEHQALFDTNYFGVVCSMPVPLPSSVCFSTAHIERECPEQRQRQQNLLLI